MTKRRKHINATEEVFEWKDFTLGNEYEMGDVNIDSNVNVSDIMLTVKQVMGMTESIFRKKTPT